jgi:hypothetical protein
VTLEDGLERLAGRTPPGDPADVMAAARARAGSRPDARSPRFLPVAAAVVAVLALAGGAVTLVGGDESDSMTVAGPDDNPAPTAEEVPVVSVTGEGMGPLAASVSSLAPSDTSWLGHTVELRNTGDSTVYVRDLRKGTMLGDREVATATQGCGYGPEPDARLLCVTDLRVVTVEPGDTHTVEVNLWRDLPGMNPVGGGPYEWRVPVIHSTEPFVEPDDGGTTGTVTLTYDNLRTAPPDDVCVQVDDSRPSARCGGVDGPVMFGPEQHAEMEQAQLSGRLLDEDDCLYLLQESDAARYAPLPVVWPYGATWQDSPAGVLLADGTLVPVGAFLTASGGIHDIDRLAELGHAESVAGRARQCGADVPTVAYVQGEVTVGDVDAAVEGDAAVWDVDAAGPPAPSATAMTALVTRLGCSGGETGKVLEPVVVADAEQVVVTFSVEPLPNDAYPCPGNDSVPYVVELGEPLGNRELVDGACLSGEAASTSFCADGAVRWPRPA